MKMQVTRCLRIPLAAALAFSCAILTGPCVAGGTRLTFDPAKGFVLGVFGPFTSWSHDYLAAAIAFDLDFRKHIDPALRERLGPAVVNISNIHPSLNFTLQIGTSHSEPEIGLETALEWLLGTGDSDPVVGLIGGVHSSISMPIASVAAIYKVPQIGWCTTSPTLSDKQRYPYFSRTIPPDNLLGLAMWAWKGHFKVPAVSVFFSLEAYGSGLYEAVREAAALEGQLDRVTAVSFDYMPETDFHPERLKESVELLRISGIRFVIMCVSGITPVMYTLEIEGLLYAGTHQFLGSESSLKAHELYPSNGYPIGYQRFQPVTMGAKFQAFEELWSRMTIEDIYGEEAIRRYSMDAMHVPLTANPLLLVTNATFQPDYLAMGTWQACLPFVFDAGYAFVFAINNLLHRGFEPEAIQGQDLLDELRAMHFEGITGAVSFDASGDRKSDYELFNSFRGNNDLKRVGLADSLAQTVSILEPDAAVMWVTGDLSATAPASFMSCSPGEEWNYGIGRCSPCSRGFTSSGGAHAVCTACPAGSTSDTDATSCESCKKGWYSDLPGADCIECPPGHFSGSQGASACVACAVGTFASNSSASACERCGKGFDSQGSFTTMTQIEVEADQHIEITYLRGAISAASCGCDRHWRNISSGECVPCAEGLECQGLGSVRLQKGYYAANDLSVFRCHGDTLRCIGGPPGNLCAEGRMSLTCAECKSGFTPASRGRCLECNGSDRLPFASVVIIALCFLVLAYHFIDTHNRATQSHALLLCSFALAQLITVTQQMSVVGMLSLEWKEPMKTFFKVTGVLAFNLEALRLGCVGHIQPFMEYLIKVFAILAAVLLVLLIHCLFVIVRHKGHFRRRAAVLIGAVGTLCMVFYISATSAILEPLQCLSHPNHKWTVRAYPTIICWETNQHASMLLLGGLAFILVPLGFLVAVAAIVKEFPKRMRQGDSRCVTAFSFLFFRFRSGCHSYVLVHLSRSLLVALVLVVPHSLLQILLLNSILLGAFAITLLWLPWRIHHANVLDGVLACMMMLLLNLSAAFIPEEDKNLEGIAEFCLVAVCVILAVVPVLILYGIWKRYFRKCKPFQFFLCHHKAGSGAWTRLLKMHLTDSSRLQTDVFMDSDNLDHLDRLFNYVGHDTQTLVVVGTQDILRRPWCLGEMCTARLQSVNTVVVALPSFEDPTDAFIAEVERVVSNLEILTESGLTIEMLKETLKWMRNLSRIEAPQLVTLPIMKAIVGKLFSKIPSALVPIGEAALTQGGTAKPTSWDSRSMLVCDMADTESSATALILRRLLAPLLANEADIIPAIVGSDDDVAQSVASMTLVVCTNLAFARVSFLLLLCDLSSNHTNLLPIIAEASFQIPGKDFEQRLRELSFEGEERHMILAITTALFRTIGVSFLANFTSEKVLKVSAAEVASHIRGHISLSQTRTSFVLSLTPVTGAQDSSELGRFHDSCLSRQTTERDALDVALDGQEIRWLKV